MKKLILKLLSKDALLVDQLFYGIIIGSIIVDILCVIAFILFLK